LTVDGSVIERDTRECDRCAAVRAKTHRSIQMLVHHSGKGLACGGAHTGSLAPRRLTDVAAFAGKGKLGGGLHCMALGGRRGVLFSLAGLDVTNAKMV
jgi:hypothetical protein